MPTYSYKCATCDHTFDVHQNFSDDALTVCPECGGTLRKVFGNVGVTFKGSGFYRTDSRAGTPSAKKQPAASETSSAPAAPAPASSTPAASKPAAPTPAA
jgi:putative FmdB family regulatory protein